MGGARKSLQGLGRNFVPASVGNAIPQGASVGRPHNSALTKFAIRPKNNPKQLLEAIKSPTDHGLAFRFSTIK